MSVNALLNSGKTALLTQQMAIDVVSHNISNVNTPGYSRQLIEMETNQPAVSSPGRLGTGVQAVEIQRIYDRFLVAQINDENQSLGNWEAQKNALERVELIFDESSGYGLNQAMSEFWNAWQDLTNNPSDSAARTALLGKSDILTNTFNDIYSNLVQIQEDMDTSITGTITEINSIAGLIASLNDKIAKIEVDGQNANDYRDSRDLLLKDLSLLIDIEAFEKSDGKVTVLVAGGRPLVENIAPWDLSTQSNASGFQDIVWTDNEGNLVDITDNISGGKLNGWLEVRDVIIPDYLSNLDDLANGIIQEVNNLHSNGFGLDSSTGNDFFTGTSALDIGVNQDLVDDINKIAAAGSLGGVPGDNSNALDIAGLQNKLAMNGSSSTFDDYYNSLVSNVGSDVLAAKRNFDHESLVMAQLDNRRESLSGISLDEEMVNLIKFQHAYNAAAKLITTADELLESVVNML